MSDFVIGRIDFEFALGTAAAGESAAAIPAAVSAVASIIDPSPATLQGTATKEDIT